MDIVTRILDYADSRSYDRSKYISKACRQEWAQHPRVSGLKLFSPVTKAYSPSTLRKFKHMHLIRSRLASAPDEDPSAHRRVHVPNVDIDYAKSIGPPVLLYLWGDDWDIPAFRFDLKVRPRERIRANYLPSYHINSKSVSGCRRAELVTSSSRLLWTRRSIRRRPFDVSIQRMIVTNQSCDSSVNFIPRPYDYAHFER